MSVAKENVKSGTPFLHFLRSSHWSVINRGKRNASFTVFAVCCRLTQTLKSSDTSSGFNGEVPWASVRSRGGFQPQYYVYTDVKYQGHHCSGFQQMLCPLFESMFGQSLRAGIIACMVGVKRRRKGGIWGYERAKDPRRRGKRKRL